MPAIAVIGDVTTGHAGYPPTPMISSPIEKTKFNGKKPGVVDPDCQFAPHSLGTSVHPSEIRTPKKGSSKTKIEGYYLARIGDELNDGDIIAAGSDNSFIE
jgi:uncharacterized Zn-binding protein involved in type VI secretion